MKIILDEGVIMPVRAHSADAGLDLFSREDKVVPARGSAIFDTGVHLDIPVGQVGFLKSKSGLNVKYGLTSDGTVDAQYSGSIIVKLYNHSDTDYEVKVGDKISQIVIQTCELPELEVVDSFEPTERGDSGFGSTGR